MSQHNQQMVLQSGRVFSSGNGLVKRQSSIRFNPPASLRRVRVVKRWSEGNRTVSSAQLMLSEEVR